MKTAKLPFVYSGSGSAIDNYHSEKPKNNENWGLFDKNNQQHRTILSLLRQLQWTKKHDRHIEVADIERFSNWLKSDLSPVKKPLKSMEPKEVSKIIGALEAMQSKKYK